MANDRNKIGPGDMVMLVRWPHPCESTAKSLSVGAPFIVKGLQPIAWCSTCGATLNEPAALVLGRSVAYPLSWLQKINPPDTSKTTEREKELVLCER